MVLPVQYISYRELANPLFQWQQHGVCWQVLVMAQLKAKWRANGPDQVPSMTKREMHMQGLGAAVVAMISLAPPSVIAIPVSQAQQKCSLGSKGIQLEVIPCSVFSLNGTLTYVWQYSGRGIGTTTVALGQWSKRGWKACSNRRQCIVDSSGFSVSLSSCPITKSVQPIELSPRWSKPLPSHC